MVKRSGQGLSVNPAFSFDHSIILDAITSSGIKATHRKMKALSTYQWQYYSELARQRSIFHDDIQQALIQTCISYEFQHWQRAVKYKYGLHPFCTQGSLINIGGRFNTGKDVNAEVPFFPALYLAKNKDTALQEHLGQQTNNEIGSELTPREIALTNPSSEVIVSVSGRLDKVFDLTNVGHLTPFVNIIKNFKISKELLKLASQLKLPKPILIKTAQDLLQTFLDPNWRQYPMLWDIPSNSQIFGYLIYLAGIEGILYPSKFTGDLCLALFPANFVATDSFTMLDDEAPHPNVPMQINSSNWRISELSATEIINNKEIL